MADYGIKIAKTGKSITSTDIDDYIYWSKYQGLPLLYKTTVAITATPSNCAGTYTYTHNLGFAPMVIGATDSYTANTRLILPYTVAKNFEKLYCDDANMNENFKFKSKINTIDIIYAVTCIIPQWGEGCLSFSKTYNIDLYLFMLKLGS